MRRLESLRYKRHQGARKDTAETDMTRITKSLPPHGEMIKVSSSSYVTMAQPR